MTVFSVMALVIASLGVYAMFASLDAAREREFGVRMALGSTRRAIGGIMLRQGDGWMDAGISGGALGVVLVVRLRGWLYGVTTFETIALGACLANLVGCDVLAMIGTLRRAMYVDIANALRVD